MENNRNFFITIALSVLILTVWQVFYMNPKIESEREAARIKQELAGEQTPGQPAAPAMPGVDAPAQRPARPRSPRPSASRSRRLAFPVRST